MGIERLRAAWPGMAAAILVMALATAAAASAVNTDSRTGLAISGYDPVAYFTQGKPVKGDPAITARHDGALYSFASEHHREMFMGDPDKYSPQFGGFCAYGVAKGVRAGIDPQAFTITGGKLYLNYSLSVQQTWRQDVPGYVARAQANWRQLGAD